MSAKIVQGSHMSVYFRNYGTTDPFLKLVCEDNLVFDLNNDVSTVKTKCGVFKGIDVADFKLNGSGVCNITPTALVEMSLDAIQVRQIARTKQEFVIQNEAYTDSDGTSIAIGHQIKMSGGGYFTASQLSAGVSDPVKFTYNFEGEGIPNVTES